MSDKPNSTLALVIDTSRQHCPRLLDVNNPHGSSPDLLRSPGTSSSNTTSLWSSSFASVSNHTPSTGHTIASSIHDHCFSRTPRNPTTGSTVSDPEWLISQIDEYLADLDVAPSTAQSANSLHRQPLKIEINPEVLSSVERALPSSPDALRMSHIRLPAPLLPSAVARRASMPSSPSDWDDGFTSPLFYRAFQRPEGGVAPADDAAPFPYSPCRESVSLESGYFASSIMGRMGDFGSRRPSLLDDIVEKKETEMKKEVEVKVGDGGWSPKSIRPKEEEGKGEEGKDVPSIRLEAAAEDSDICSSTGDAASSQSSPLSAFTSISSCEGANSRMDDARSRPNMDSAPQTTAAAAAVVEAASRSSNFLSAENGCDRSDRRNHRQFQPTDPSPSSAASLHVPTLTPPPLRARTVPLIPPPTIPPRRGLSRSASAGNLPRYQPHHDQQHAAMKSKPTIVHSPESVVTAIKGFIGHPGLKKDLTPSPPSLAPTKATVSTSNASPTSTQIVEGVRKMNKLKKLLGEEVGSHIPHPTARWVASTAIPPLQTSFDPPPSHRFTTKNTTSTTNKPLPCLPAFPSPQRSNTTFTHPTSMHKSHPSLKTKCCTTNNGRPSTARESRCRCANCTSLQLGKISSSSSSSSQQRQLSSALAGTSLRLPASNHHQTRPSTASSLKTRAAGMTVRKGSFFEMDD
ncbi:uncharacterized protein UTRI_01776 [Ustilago trichophora]|uniref:Uncharacterized protein n=1 Tax=Ustilago trichophora TaxID=86804 RepID=A0A5C3DY14_9BASI|nr:uncharacterized protein UTRI_01776 [Ustilago trichophora]